MYGIPESHGAVRLERERLVHHKTDCMLEGRRESGSVRERSKKLYTLADSIQRGRQTMRYRGRKEDCEVNW